jgi:hypothetical protein
VRKKQRRIYGRERDKGIRGRQHEEGELRDRDREIRDQKRKG